MSCKPTYKGKRYNSLEELYKANGVNEQQKQQAQQLYSSYLQTTNNPTIEGFKQWNNKQQQINELFESNPKLANKDRLGVESTEESSKTEAVVTNTTATTNIDLTASYFGEESTDKTQQGKQYVPKGLKWGEWDKLGYNKESTLRNLLDNGITEEEWEEYSDAEKEAELKCKGRY